MTTDDCTEWSCGTCTFLNKPLFLSCEMCGQARPSQRPCPPRRQPSLSVDRHEPSLEPSSSRGGDRAPRSVQRHRSSTIEITGTLIMTDDPADYETQDEKKTGEDAQDEQDTGSLFEQPSRADDPTLDESMDMFEEPAAASRSNENNNEAYHHTRRSSHSDDFADSSHNGMEHLRRHTYQAPPRQQQHYGGRPPSTVVKPYGGGNSNQTLPTAYMGNSSCSSFADDASSLSSGRSSGRFANSASSARRHTAHDIHCHGRRSSNGLPVVTRGGEPTTPNNRSRHPRRSSGAIMMGDASISSQDSLMSGSIRSPATTPRGTRRPTASMRHIHGNNSATANSSRNSSSSMRRGGTSQSFCLPSGGDFIESVLPSLDPPPVPTMDSPGDVDVMAVFVRDAEKAQNRRKSANETRKDRGKMLDNLSSRRDLIGGSEISASSRRLQSHSTRGLSTRLLGDQDQEGSEQPAILQHPAMTMMQDNEVLDSPNTRKERRNKEKKRMKGAVRTLMATMRIASVAK